MGKNEILISFNVFMYLDAFDLHNLLNKLSQHAKM
jgi:hypothetical protein